MPLYLMLNVDYMYPENTRFRFRLTGLHVIETASFKRNVELRIISVKMTFHAMLISNITQRRCV